MHKKITKIFFALSFLFISAVKLTCAQNSADIAAKINDSLVPNQYFQTIYDRFIADYKSTNPGAAIDNQTIQWAKKYVMDEIIKRELIMQEARKANIKVSEEEIEQQIKLDPFFKDKNGKFDKTKYLWAKNDPKIDWAKIKASLYEEVMFMKFEKSVMNSGKVTEKEILDEYKKNNEKIKMKFFLVKNPEIQENQISEKESRDFFEKNRQDFVFPETSKVKYILLLPDKFEKEANIDNNEIKAYYNSHLEEYKFPERAGIQYIMLNLPQDGNTLALQEKVLLAQNILKELKEGMDFSQAAKKYSEEKVSAEKGGDAGYVKRGQAAKEIEDVIFSLKQGQISGVERLFSQLYIFKAKTKKPAGIADLEEVRETIVSKLKIEVSMKKAYQKAQEFTRLKNLSEFEEKSSLYGGLVETKFFSKDESIETLGLIPEFNNAAFQLNPGQINTQVITVMLYPGYNAYIVLAVIDRMQAHPAKYEDVETKTNELLVKEKQIQLLKSKVEQLMQKLNPENFEVKAKETGETVSEISITRAQSYMDKIGYSPGFTAAVFDSFTLDIKAFYLPFGACIYKIIEKTDINETAFKREKEDIKKRLLTQKNTDFFYGWYEALKARSKIEVYLKGN